MNVARAGALDLRGSFVAESTDSFAKESNIAILVPNAWPGAAEDTATLAGLDSADVVAVMLAAFANLLRPADGKGTLEFDFV